MTAVTQVDPELVLVNYLRGILPSVPQAAGYTVGTRVEPGVTPAKAIKVRSIGGATEKRIGSRPRLDVRIWADGSPLTEGAAKTLARILLGRIEADLHCRTFATPIALPDPADPAKVLVSFSTELLLKGSQS
jgi:hypothetical protein